MRISTKSQMTSLVDLLYLLKLLWMTLIFLPFSSYDLP